jgi:hypothetical protein
MNLLIRKLQEDIVKVTNESPLPIEVKRLVFNEIARAVAQEADRVAMEEMSKQNIDSENTEEKG